MNPCGDQGEDQERLYKGVYNTNDIEIQNDTLIILSNHVVDMFFLKYN